MVAGNLVSRAWEKHRPTACAPGHEPAQPLLDGRKAYSLAPTSPAATFMGNSGVGKLDPARNAHRLPTRPWTVTPRAGQKLRRTLDLDDIRRPAPLEEPHLSALRRGLVHGHPLDRLSSTPLLRQVEPWAVPLRRILSPTTISLHVVALLVVLDSPTSRACRPGQSAPSPDPLLTLASTARSCPTPNGAPLRVVIPGNTSFMSGKSVVRTPLRRGPAPHLTWIERHRAITGFCANVNPRVDHLLAGASQERRIGEFRNALSRCLQRLRRASRRPHAGMVLARTIKRRHRFVSVATFCDPS